jgi:hypothetical protein
MASETKTKAKVVKLKLCFGQKPNKPQKMWLHTVLREDLASPSIIMSKTRNVILLRTCISCPSIGICLFLHLWAYLSGRKVMAKNTFRDLLWEKSIIEWLVIRKISSREKHYFYICQRSFVIY